MRITWPLSATSTRVVSNSRIRDGGYNDLEQYLGLFDTCDQYIIGLNHHLITHNGLL